METEEKLRAMLGLIDAQREQADKAVARLEQMQEEFSGHLSRAVEEARGETERALRNAARDARGASAGISGAVRGLHWKITAISVSVAVVSILTLFGVHWYLGMQINDRLEQARVAEQSMKKALIWEKIRTCNVDNRERFCIQIDTSAGSRGHFDQGYFVVKSGS